MCDSNKYCVHGILAKKTSNYLRGRNVIPTKNKLK